MSDAAQLLAIPLPFTFKATEYSIMGADFEILKQFEIWIQSTDIDEIRRRRRTREIDGNEYAAFMADHRRDVATRQFAYGGALWWQARFTLPGRKKMAQLQLSSGGGGELVDMGIIEQIFDSPEDLEAFETIQAQADADPNLQKPWKAGKKNGAAVATP